MTNHDGAGHCEKCGRVILRDGIHIGTGRKDCNTADCRSGRGRTDVTTVNLNRARDEMDQLCRACAFDVLTACRCVTECGAARCMGAETTATCEQRQD